MPEPTQPSAKTGVENGETKSTDHTRNSDRPAAEEDVFGGAERAKKGEEVKSGNAKP